MYKCKKCGYEFEGKFCPECGAKREEEKVCAGCGAKLTAGVKFCPECGMPVQSASAIDTAAAASTAGKSISVNTTASPLQSAESRTAQKKPQPVESGASDDLFAFGNERQTVNKPEIDYDKKLSFTLWFLGRSYKFWSFMFFGSTALLVSLTGFMLYHARFFGRANMIVPTVSAVLGVVGIVLFVFAGVSLCEKKAAPSYTQLIHIYKMFFKGWECTTFLLVIAVIVAFFGIVSGTTLGWFNAVAAVLLCLVTSTVYIASMVLCKRTENRYIVKNADDTLTNYMSPYVVKSVEDMQKAAERYATLRNERRTAAGKPPKTAHEYEKEKTILKFIISLAVTVLCGCVFLLVAFAPRNAFNINRLERISVGDDMGYVTTLLGKPLDDSQEQSDGNGSGVYTYCNDPIAKKISIKNAQLEKLENSDNLDNIEKALDIAAEILELELQLSVKRCDYIYVSYADGKVTEINFEKDVYYGNELTNIVKQCKYYYCANRTALKTIGENLGYLKYDDIVTVNSDSSESGGYSTYHIYVREYFVDGGMLNKEIEIKVDASKEGVQEVKWFDIYGEHKLYVLVK